jgi:hypothetical protein
MAPFTEGEDNCTADKGCEKAASSTQGGEVGYFSRLWSSLRRSRKDPTTSAAQRPIEAEVKRTHSERLTRSSSNHGKN